MLGRQPGLAGAEQRREGSRQCGNRERECETKHELLIGRRQRLLDLRSQIPETELQDLALRECARHDSNVRPFAPEANALSPELRARDAAECIRGLAEGRSRER